MSHSFSELIEKIALLVEAINLLASPGWEMIDDIFSSLLHWKTFVALTLYVYSTETASSEIRIEKIKIYGQL